jgi:DNA transformation protein
MKRPSTNPFLQHVLDQLRDLGQQLRSRAMFGAHGLYCDESFFAIVWRGQLFFKTSPETVVRYQSHDMECFQPSPTVRLKNYHEVPESIIERPDELLLWAQEAIAVAQA